MSVKNKQVRKMKARPEEAYYAAWNGTSMECTHCRSLVESWDVVGPDDMAISTMSTEEDARCLADMLNEAHEVGTKSGIRSGTQKSNRGKETA